MPEQSNVDSDPKHLKIVSAESLESDHDSEILRIMNSKDAAANGAVDEAVDEAAAGARRCWRAMVSFGTTDPSSI